MRTLQRGRLWLLVAVAASCQDEARDARGTSREAVELRTERGSQRCDASDATVVVDSLGIGPVLRGVRVADVASRCPVRDTTIEIEGTRERAHVVTLRDRSLVVLSTGTPDTSIIRVVTVDPTFKTSGGVGVGSSVQALRVVYGRVCVGRGEGNLVVTAANLPGVSFAIDWNPPPSRDPSVAETPFPGGDPGTSLDAARITRLWVHGVAGGCRASVG